MSPDNRISSLQKILRKKILELHFSANAGHIGCSLSCIDLMIAALMLCKKNEDTFLLSKGHAVSSLYSCLNYMGEISDEELKTYYKNGTKFPAHPAPNSFKGIPFATGSLGHGFPLGTGMAKANKLSGKEGFVLVLMSDGETNEGTTWESAHFARQHKLDNLIIFIDKNQLQGFGTTKGVLGDTSTNEMWRSLGFDLSEINGHDIGEITRTIEMFKKSTNGKPKVIIANTVKGKGVSFMENKLEWHYLPMTEELYHLATEEINKNIHEISRT